MVSDLGHGPKKPLFWRIPFKGSVLLIQLPGTFFGGDADSFKKS